MRWLVGLYVLAVCLQEGVLSYKRSPLLGPGPPPRGGHVHLHHPYSKRHFNLNREHYHRGPPPYPPKPHFHQPSAPPSLHGNHLHQVHSASSHQVGVHALSQYPGAGAYLSHGVPYPSHSNPAPVSYPNPNFIQQSSSYQAPGLPAVVAQPIPTPTPTPTYLPPPTPYIPPAATYLPAYLKDDDKGPIHTIPAPNLSPADKPAGFDEFMLKNTGLHSNLISGHYRPKPLLHYQVSEDIGSSKGALFAPDPDPSVPTLKVPPTTDPHSIPTNGQVPLDLYLQQEAEKQQMLQEQALQQQVLQQQVLQHQALQQQVLHSQQSDQDENSLTAQDLFNLLNYQPNVIPESQLQQHVLQPNVQFYSNPLYLQHSQFMNPQYHNFNYDERTQQSAYGTDSFPLQSLSSYFGNPEESNLLDSVNTNEISKKLDQRDTKKTSEKYRQEKLSYTTLSSKDVADALATLSAAGALNNGEQQLNDQNNDNDEIMNQEENRSVGVYENLNENEQSQAHARNIEPDSEASSSYNLIKSEKLTDLDLHLENQLQNRNRVRPKRY